MKPNRDYSRDNFKSHKTNYPISRVEEDENGDIVKMTVNHTHYYRCDRPHCGSMHPENTKCDKSKN